MSAGIEIRPSFRPSGPAEIADGAFEIVRRSFGAMLAVSVLVNVPLFATAAGLAWWVREQGLLWGSPRYFAGLTLLSFAAGAATWLRAIGTGALAHAALVTISGREARPAASLAAAFRTGAAVPAALAIRAAMFGMGLVACVLPSLVVAGAFAFVTHAIVLERRGVSAALLRSVRVAPHAGGGLFAATALATLGWGIAALQVLLFVRLGASLSQAALPLPEIAIAPNVLAWLAVGLAKIAVDPLVSAASASAWVDGLIRADGLDLELRAQRIAGEPLLVDPEATA